MSLAFVAAATISFILVVIMIGVLLMVGQFAIILHDNLYNGIPSKAFGLSVRINAVMTKIIAPSLVILFLCGVDVLLAVGISALWGAGL